MMAVQTGGPDGRPVIIDGAQGEGGGQLLRSALALAAVRGLPVSVERIRAGRPRPGLQPQHLTAVGALRTICAAAVEGALPGSDSLTFRPGRIAAGEYRFAVGTAGSVTLVVQAILPLLALADGPSRVVVEGGTHVPWSPPVHYLQEVLLPLLGRIGIEARVRQTRWGFYPQGGGEIVLEVKGGAQLRPVSLVRVPAAPRLRGISVVSRLPWKIAERQRQRVLERLAERGLTAEVAVEEAAAADSGSFLFLQTDAGGLPAGFSALGERGKPAERVADEAVDELLAYLQSEAACDGYLADQLCLPLALAPGTSRITTVRISRHLLSALAVSQQLLGCPYQVSGPEGTAGSLTLEGVGGRRAPGAERRAPSGGQRAAGSGRAEPRVEGGERQDAPRASRHAPHAGGVIVRKALASDVPAMQELVAHFAARGELLPRDLHEFYQHLRDFVVAEEAGRLVGICALSVYWEDLAEVRSLAVREEYAGHGVGSRLVKACIEEAVALGVRRVFALTYRPGFFGRLGFRVLDKRELPQKIWKDCFKCAKFASCDETALIRDTEEAPSAEGRGPRAEGES
jgi:RNA 3'-terminal phosphate cyclase (ATP)